MYFLPFKKQDVTAYVSSFQFSKMEGLLIQIILAAILINIFWCIYFINILFYPNIAKADSPSVPTELTKEQPNSQKLTEHFEGLGFQATVVKEIKRKNFSVQGKMMLVSNDNIQVFEYPDTITAANEASLLAQRYAESSRSAEWKNNIHLYADENTVVFYMGENKKIIESLDQNTSLTSVQPTQALTKAGK